jgi:glutathione synthase/RimK-type ligase-like ATP-grasp enzyme
MLPLVLFATAHRLPTPDLETPLVVEALNAGGIAAEIQPWDAPVDWSKADLVVVRSTWDYYERRDEFVRWAYQVEATTRLVNPAAVVEWNSHKGYLVELAGRGISTVPTALFRRGTLAPDWAEMFDGDSELVVKPSVSVGAVGALRGSPAEVAGHLGYLMQTGDVLVQPLIPSVLTQGETSLVFFGGKFSHAVRKIPRPGEYRVQEHHGGTVQPHEPERGEMSVAGAAIAAAPMPPSYARADLVATSNGPALMELELIEPFLFLATDPPAAARFAALIGQTV